MGKKDDTKHRARHTLEFKLEAVRLVKNGQDADVTARVLGMPKQTLGNWLRLSEKGPLQGAGDKPVSAGQMEPIHDPATRPFDKLMAQGSPRAKLGYSGHP